MCLHAETAGESGERARGSDDAMARHHDRNRVSAVRSTHGPRGHRLSDLPRDLRVGSRLSERYGQQRTPHLALKMRSGGIQLQRELLPPPGKILLELPLGL